MLDLPPKYGTYRPCTLSAGKGTKPCWWSRSASFHSNGLVRRDFKQAHFLYILIRYQVSYLSTTAGVGVTDALQVKGAEKESLHRNKLSSWKKNLHPLQNCARI